MMLDFPHPLGPTIPDRLPGRVIEIGSTKDLKPEIFILSMRICIKDNRSQFHGKILFFTLTKIDKCLIYIDYIEFYNMSFLNLDMRFRKDICYFVVFSNTPTFFLKQ